MVFTFVRTEFGAAPLALSLLAHQGGWDEILLIAGPILVIIGLLVVAKRRVEAAAAGAAAASADTSTTDTGDETDTSDEASPRTPGASASD